MVSFFVAVVIGIPIAYCIYSFYQFYIKYLRDRPRIVKLLDQIPGPPALPLVGNALEFETDEVEFTWQLVDWLTTYAMGNKGVMRLWIGPQPYAILATPEAAEPVLKSRSLITKSEMYDILRPWIRNGMLVSTGAYWRSRRKLISPTLHTQLVITNFVPTIVRQGKVLVDLWAKYADSGEPFNCSPYAKRFALDATMNVNIGAQTDKNLLYTKAIDNLYKCAIEYGKQPHLWTHAGWYLTGFNSRFSKSLVVLKELSTRVIRERRAILTAEATEKGISIREMLEDGRKVAILDRLLSEADAEKLSEEDIREEVDNFISGGHDTTGVTIGYMIFNMAANPKIQAALQEEQRDVFGDSDRDCTMEDLSKMEYLERALKESLRFFPSVPMFSRRLTEDVDTQGYTLPAGCTAIISPFFMHRDPQHWERPNEYWPDHFLPEAVTKRHPYAYVPFSAGLRNCIGQKFAATELKLVMSALLRAYTFESDARYYEDVNLPEINLRPKHGITVSIKRNK